MTNLINTSKTIFFFLTSCNTVNCHFYYYSLFLIFSFYILIYFVHFFSDVLHRLFLRFFFKLQSFSVISLNIYKSTFKGTLNISNNMFINTGIINVVTTYVCTYVYIYIEIFICKKIHINLVSNLHMFILI